MHARTCRRLPALVLRQARSNSTKHNYVQVGGRRIKVSDVGIPLEPVISLAEILPEPRKFTRDELLKLHRLAALEPPTTEEEWTSLSGSLGELAAIMESIKDDKSLDVENEDSPPDGRVRMDDDIPYDQKELPDPKELMPKGSLLDLSQSREGPFYASPTPRGVRAKGSTANRSD